MPRAVLRLMLRTRLRRLDALTTLYAEVTAPEAIAARQLARFNTHWQQAWRRVPFYTDWRAKHGLPERIESLADLGQFPVLTKATISDARDLVGQSPNGGRSTLTGGTSGISTAFPMGPDDADSAWIDTHLGRRWNGIEAGDPLFMIWGHSHLFSGAAAWRKQLKRRLKDRAANITRVSAYDLAPSTLGAMAEAIRRQRPAYVIGYGSCLARLCGFLHGAGRSLAEAGVHRVVNTSESMTPADVPLVSRVFCCPVINEYGMAETGVIGYSRAKLYPISVFWNNFILRSLDRRLIVTTLGARCFPLINYDTEDLCDDPTPPAGALIRLDSLLGKARDVFEMRDIDGALGPVSVVLFDHILKQIAPLRSLHYSLSSEGRVSVAYTSAAGPLAPQRLQARFAKGLAQEGIRIDAAAVTFTWLEAPLQTIAGKRRSLTRVQEGRAP